MATGSDLFALEMHIDVIPMVKAGFNFIDHLLVGIPKTIHGLVGKHHTPAKGVVGRVSVKGGDVVAWIGLCHEKGEIQAGWATT